MSRLTIHWPDEAAERVDAARGRLEVAAAQLAARPLEERTRVLAAVLDRWGEPACPERRALLDQHPAASGFTRETLEAGLALGLAPYRGDALRALVERELSAPIAAGARIAPFATTSVLLAGAIPMPALLQIVLSLVAGSPVLVRPSARDGVSAEQVQRSIAAVDAEMGRCVEVVPFASDDADALARFCASPCVVASGDDATIAAIRAAMRAGQRLVAYAHRHSIAVADAGFARSDAAAALARDLSLDVALWDQLGCLSPTALFVVGDDARDAALALGGELAEALARREASLPRGAVDARTAAAIATARSEAEMRNAAGQGGALHVGPGTTWSVSVEVDERWRASPLHRFLRVHAVGGVGRVGEILESPGVGALSNVALVGFDEEDAAILARDLTRCGASRFCAPGELQAPPLDWPHDGAPVLAPLTLWRSDGPLAR